MRTRAITTDEYQRVTFIELFFDLVFVYAVTQLVALLHHELSWAGAGLLEQTNAELASTVTRDKHEE